MADRILRVPETLSRVGFGRTSLWRRVRAGEFPAPRQLGGGMIGFLESEVSAWLESRPKVGEETGSAV